MSGCEVCGYDSDLVLRSLAGSEWAGYYCYSHDPLLDETASDHFEGPTEVGP